MMTRQNYEQKSDRIREAFEKWKAEQQAGLGSRLHLSWSNWGFGMEPLADSVKRLKRAGVDFIELHGNHYGPDLGYKVDETRKILDGEGVKCAGVCGMFSADNDLSSNRGIQRQAAVDYLKRTIAFAHEIGGGYILVVPGAVGRPTPYDSAEFERSVATLQLVADQFESAGIKAAIEPIRSAEVSLIHTIDDAKAYLAAVNHPGVQHINGDVYHMQVEESHIGAALIEAGERLTNLHLADSNRCALGEGSLDVDTIIMALYVIGYNRPGCYCTPEPLGPGGDPYPAMHGKADPARLDALVNDSIAYFREREAELLA